MRFLFSIALLVLASGLLLAPVATAQEPYYPEPSGYVVDEAGLLSPATIRGVTVLAMELQDKTGAQLAIATVPSIAPLEVEEYAVELFQRWGVGQRGEDNGVLIVIARDERRIRIEVGYGLEGILPDGKVGTILRRDIVPALRQDNWDLGISDGAVALASVIAQDKGVVLESIGGSYRTPSQQREGRGSRKSRRGFGVLGFFFLMMFISAFSGRRRRRGGASAWWLLPFFLLAGAGGRGGGFGGGFGGSGGGGFGGFGGGMGGGGGASSGF